MKESDLCRGLAEALRRLLPGAVVIKHADRMTAGVPDLSVTWGGRTVWVEVKYFRAGSTRGAEFGIQWDTCRRLALAGLCVYAVYSDQGARLVSPDGLRAGEGGILAWSGKPSGGHAAVALALKTAVVGKGARDERAD